MGSDVRPIWHEPCLSGARSTVEETTMHRDPPPDRPPLSQPREDLAPTNATRVRRARLLETPHCTIDWDDERSLVWFIRTALPYRRTADIVRERMLVHRALGKAARARVLVDLRAVALYDDPSCEGAIAALRRVLFSGGERMAILAGTAIGVLQARRHVREDGFRVEVFSREEDALAFFGATSKRAPGAGGDGAAPALPSWGSGPFRLR
jgi:hypothetical protein